MGYTDTLGKALRVFLNPKAATSNSMSVGDSLKFYYKLMPIPLVLGLIVSFLVAKFIAPLAGYGIVAMIAVYFIIGFPLGIIIDGGIYHIENIATSTTPAAYAKLIVTACMCPPALAISGSDSHPVNSMGMIEYAKAVVILE